MPPDPPDPVDTVRRGVMSEKRRSISHSLRAAVIRRDGLHCYLCNRAVIPEQVHIDHVIPVARGGQTNIDNLAVTHSHCNLAKSDRITDKRPPALYGVDCGAALGPPEPLRVRERAVIPVARLRGDEGEVNKKLGRWRPRHR